jgi:hypothetical protein
MGEHLEEESLPIIPIYNIELTEEALEQLKKIKKICFLCYKKEIGENICRNSPNSNG